MHLLFVFFILLLSPVFAASDAEGNRQEWLKSLPILPGDPYDSLINTATAAVPGVVPDEPHQVSLPAQLEHKAIAPALTGDDILFNNLCNAATDIDAYNNLGKQLSYLTVFQQINKLDELAARGLAAGPTTVCRYLKARTNVSAPRDNFTEFYQISINPAVPAPLKIKAETKMLRLWREEGKYYAASWLAKDKLFPIMRRVIDSQDVGPEERTQNAFIYAELLHWQAHGGREPFELYELIIGLNEIGTADYYRAVFCQAENVMVYKPQNVNLNKERLRGVLNLDMDILSRNQERKIEIWLAELDGKQCESCWLDCCYSFFCCIWHR